MFGSTATVCGSAVVGCCWIKKVAIGLDVRLRIYSACVGRIAVPLYWKDLTNCLAHSASVDVISSLLVYRKRILTNFWYRCLTVVI